MENERAIIEYQNDHDLLIRVDEKLTGLHEKVGRLTDDHEDRIRYLEKEANRWLGKQSMIGGAIGIVAALASGLIHFTK